MVPKESLPPLLRGKGFGTILFNMVPKDYALIPKN